jgi:hypothetical protein
MFVDQTPGGVLAKKLQEVEDRLDKASGYRIRMVELSGRQLGRLLPNINPWFGMSCARPNCYTCDQGEEVLQDCKRRGVAVPSVTQKRRKEEGRSQGVRRQEGDLCGGVSQKHLCEGS